MSFEGQFLKQFQGPETDAPAVSAHSITEIKAINAEILRKRAEIIEERKKQAEQEVSDGVSWGFKEDAVESDEEEEERPESVNPFSLPEELDLEDPKKTLKGCFEREGYEVEYVCEDQGFGNHMCRIEFSILNTVLQSKIQQHLLYLLSEQYELKLEAIEFL